MLSRHTQPACQAKYRFVKNKEAESEQRTRAVNESGPIDDDQGLKDMGETGPGQNNQDKPTSADPVRPNKFTAVNNDKDVADQSMQNGGGN